MKKAETLEDFIKTYIENKKISDTPESYSKWLKTYGVDSEKILSQSISDIESDYAREKSTYGKNAEMLSSIGLGASGYSDYIGAKAYETMQKRKTGAFNTYSENIRKNANDFSIYAEEILEKNEAAKTKENEKFYKTVKNIVDSGIRGEDEAYAFAIEAGLSEEKAKAAAKTAAETAKRQLTSDAFGFIIKNGFDKNQAKEYALAVGLDEAVAEKLAEYANSISYDPYLSSDYLDYLKNKENYYK